MIGRVVARAILVAAAVAAGLWLAAGLRAVRLEARAERLAEKPPNSLPRAEVDRIVRLFERARDHNPDVIPLVREGEFLTRQGRTADGLELIEEAIRREPSNLQAWSTLVFAASGPDPARAREARARVRALSPPPRP
jgi:cytochrome c-type biogenesis protein CcmH/NrfG